MCIRDRSKYAPLFWERGCDLLIFDARYHGESTGDYGTYGYYEKLDTSKAIDWFSQQVGLPPERIGLLGESYGAATALETAALRPDIAFAAADSSYRDLETIISEPVSYTHLDVYKRQPSIPIVYPVRSKTNPAHTRADSSP